MTLLKKFEHRVERVCIVDKPVDYPFLPDSFFSYMAKKMPKLQVSDCHYLLFESFSKNIKLFGF